MMSIYEQYNRYKDMDPTAALADFHIAAYRPGRPPTITAKASSARCRRGCLFLLRISARGILYR